MLRWGLHLSFFGGLRKADLGKDLFHISFVEHVLFTVISEVYEHSFNKRGGLRIAWGFAAVALPMG